MESFEDLRQLIAGLTVDQIEDLVAELPMAMAQALLDVLAQDDVISLPASPIEQARALDPGWRDRPHLAYISDRIAAAVEDVERGVSRRLIIELPPRTGKTQLATTIAPAWILRKHPTWPIALTSHDPALATSWGRTIRRWLEDGKLAPLAIAPDAGAASAWETADGGKMLSVSIRESFTGRGAKVLLIDDPIKDFVEAHSQTVRESIWNWWLSVAQTRLEPPSLVIVVMTRWHEDDLVGRLLSPLTEGEPSEWEVIRLPALAEEDDLLGRRPGEPLLSPLLEETSQEALARWDDVRRSVGTYTFASMYQQRPAPAKGAIFDSSWWRFWTMFPEKATDDGRVVYLDPSTLVAGRWLDSWDAAFKSRDDKSSGWVVGQRWCRLAANRYLIAQRRGRWSFTQTIAQMLEWAAPSDPVHSPCGHLVHERLIEERANGAAIIDVLKEKVSGIKPINPTISKEARARAVTPECESGNVFLPYPSDPGNEWMQDFLSEMRNFPHDVADDQVDALTQALAGLREPGKGMITVPGRLRSTTPSWQAPRDIARAAASQQGRPR